MELTKEDIKKGLKKLGLRRGDVVLVHSSLSSFGYVVGGANTVINALLETVGHKGTVVVPTLTGSEKLSANNPPVFDPESTPCWTGKIPETFRKRKEAIRSLHPTHSVAAIGAIAKELLRDHEKSITPCAENSPYGKLAKLDDSYIIFMGVTLDCCTMFHHVEEVANVSYHMQKEFVEAKIIENGKIKKVKIKIHAYGTSRNFTCMEPKFIKTGIMRIGTIGNSTVRLVKTKDMVNLTLKALKRNPKILLANEEKQN